MSTAHPIVGPDVGRGRLAVLKGRPNARQEGLARWKTHTMTRTSPVETSGRRTPVPPLVALCGTIDALLHLIGLAVVRPLLARRAPPCSGTRLSAV